MRRKKYRPVRRIEIDNTYRFQFSARVVIGAITGVGAVVGMLAGLGLGFTSLSPLVIGGTIGAILPVSLVLAAIGLRIYYCDKINELKEERDFMERRAIAVLTPPFLFALVASIAAGVCVAAAANTILPGIFTTWWAAIAAGAGIGAITLPTGIVTGATVIAIFAGSMHESVTPEKYVIAG